MTLSQHYAESMEYYTPCFLRTASMGYVFCACAATVHLACSSLFVLAHASMIVSY